MVYSLFVNIGGGGSIHPLKNYGGFCVIPLNVFKQNYMADSTCYNLGFLVGLISHFEKLGQYDLNNKIYVKICKKNIKLQINHLSDFN